MREGGFDSVKAAGGERSDRGTTAALGLTALGIVYGDLGTSPLYTMQTVVQVAGGSIGRAEGLGLLSLIVWALLITISCKYALFVMRADNAGEGGILALMSLVTSGRASTNKASEQTSPVVLIAMGLFGAALLYGDGAITPAISVLSALEGVNVVTPVLKPYVLPAAVVVLIGLFAAQSWGTDKIGRVFGPVMLLWFAVIGVLGAIQVVQHPDVLAAIDPRHAIHTLSQHGFGSLAILGAVFLAVTGGEALYADMGHVGRGPIRAAWYGIVLPGLLLSYAGQTALVVDTPIKPGDNPFFLLAPSWGVWPLVILATLATIIASQAIITGAFSLTRQAMQLGWLPGMAIRQTSDSEYGQIYVPLVNWTMMAVTVGLAVGFGSSDKLAGAYGTAVATTMLLTTLLLHRAMVAVWHWRARTAALVAGGFLVVDLAFFFANILKIGDGGWVPLTMAAILYTLMLTWRRGTEAVRTRLMGLVTEPAEVFLEKLKNGAIPRVEGSGIFLTRADTALPAVMLRHVEDMGALPAQLATLTVRFVQAPRVNDGKRVSVDHVARNFWHITAHFGFVEIPDLLEVLDHAHGLGCQLDMKTARFYAAHDEVRPALKPERLLSGWRRMVFAFMYRNAVRAVDRFNLPTRHFVEIGRQIDL